MKKILLVLSEMMLKNFTLFTVLYFFFLTNSYSQGVIDAIKSSNLFEKKQSAECKAGGYKKKKISHSKSGKRTKREPYQYVYKSSTSGTITKSDFNSTPPSSNATTPTAVVKRDPNKQERHIETSASAIPSGKPSTPATVSASNSLKNMDPEERKKYVLNLPPTRNLAPIRFLSDQDEFSVVNMDSFMEALELINQGKMILIEGHTDDLGSEDYNLKLSMKRVEKIRQLMLQAGANDNLIAVMGYGESRPLIANTDNKSREINRRIEFKVFDL